MSIASNVNSHGPSMNGNCVECRQNIFETVHFGIVHKRSCPGCSNMLMDPYEHHWSCDLSIEFITARQKALRKPKHLRT